jgi:hypothetical protein
MLGLSLSGIGNKAFALQQLVGIVLVVSNIGQDFLLGLYRSPFYLEIVTTILLGLLISGALALISLLRTHLLPLTYLQLLGGFGLWLAGILIAGLRPLVESAPSHGPLAMGIAVGSYIGMIGFYLLAWWSIKNMQGDGGASRLTSPEFL